MILASSTSHQPLLQGGFQAKPGLWQVLRPAPCLRTVRSNGRSWPGIEL